MREALVRIGSTANERRVHERSVHGSNVTVLQIAILESVEERQLCLVQNVSETGMKIRAYGNLPSEDEVTVRLRGERAIAARIVWRDAPFLGVRFLDELSSKQIEMVDVAGELARAPRLDVDMRILARCGATIRPGRLRNISPSGARIELPRLQLSQRELHLRLPGLGSIDAQVRWSRGSDVGISFNRSLLMSELALLVAAWQG